MKKSYNIIILMLCMFLLIGSVNGLETLKTGKIGQTYSIIQTCADATYINISVSNINGITLSNAQMVKNGSIWQYDITPNVLGRWDVGYISDGCEKSGASYFEVTDSGRPNSSSQLFATIALICAFAIGIFVFYFVNKTVNYEKWYNSILQKYEHRNFIKVVISSIGYTLLKNKFIWYYLFILPLILIITDMTYTFGVTSMIEFMKIILMVYYFGFILVGIYFFGFLQEWIVQIKDDIKSLDFGVGE